MTPKHRTALITAAAIAAGAAVSPLASATTTTTCPVTPSAPVFAAFGDPLYYSLVSGGNFESAPVGWSISGGTVVADGVNVLRVAPDAKSLTLKEGGSVTSPAICVTQDSWFARFTTATVNVPRRGGASLRVEVLWPNGSRWRSETSTLLSTRTSWGPSPRLDTASDLKLSEGQSSSIKLRFTADKGSWGIDDVYLDPRMH